MQAHFALELVSIWVHVGPIFLLLALYGQLDLSYEIAKVLPVLEDDDNHIIDSLRYVLEPTRRAEPQVSLFGPKIIRG